MARHTSSLERETKLTAEWDFDPPDLSHVVGRTARLPEEVLRTRYFDTPDLRLWRLGITLRHRSADSSASRSRQHVEGGVWTMKLPKGQAGATLERDELTWPGEPDVVPADILRLVRGVIRRGPLGLITELVTTRRRLTLGGDQGPPWGELDDDVVTVVGGPRDGMRFRQLELELKSTAPHQADAAVAMLRRAGAQPSGEPKLATALGLPPELRPSRRLKDLGKRALLGDVVRATVAEGLDRLLEHDYSLRLDPAHLEAHDVHQARVATRRLRSNLKLFGPILDPVWLDHTRRELRWLGDALGRVRDCDVLANQLDQVPAQASIEAAGHLQLQASLSAQRLTATRELITAMGDERYLNLLDRLHAATDQPPFLEGSGTVPARRSGSPSASDPARKALPSLVAEPWRALRRKLRKAGRHPSDQDLHSTRIRAKNLRYAAEAAAPVIGKQARRTAAAAESLQTILGEHHDAVGAEQWLRHQAVKGAIQKGFRAGELAQEQRHRQQALRHQWRPIAKRVNQMDSRRWLS